MDIFELQVKIKELVTRINTNHQHPAPHLISLMKVVEELGEIASIVLTSEIKSRKGDKKLKEEIQDQVGEEVADAIISLIALANDYNVNLEETLSKKMEVHNKRN